MKYIKGTFIVFIVTLTLVTVKAFAYNENPVVVAVNDVKIPMRHGEYTTPETFLKYNGTRQKVTTIYSIDNLSGKDTLSQSRVLGVLLHGSLSTEFIDTPTGEQKTLPANSSNIQAWKFSVRAKKNLWSSQQYWGSWVVD